MTEKPKATIRRDVLPQVPLLSDHWTGEGGSYYLFDAVAQAAVS